MASTCNYLHKYNLDSDDFTRIHFDPYKHGVVLHEMPFLQHFVRDEAGKPKT